MYALILKHFSNTGCSASFIKFNILRFVVGTDRLEFVSAQHCKRHFTWNESFVPINADIE